MRKHSYYDANYSNEFGYGLIQALRGDSIGRQIKREVFVFGTIQLLVIAISLPHSLTYILTYLLTYLLHYLLIQVGFILMCIVTDNTTKWSGSYLYSNKYGINLFNLSW